MSLWMFEIRSWPKHGFTVDSDVIGKTDAMPENLLVSDYHQGYLTKLGSWKGMYLSARMREL